MALTTNPPSSAEIRVALYLYSPSGSSWPVPRRTLPLPRCVHKRDITGRLSALCGLRSVQVFVHCVVKQFFGQYSSHIVYGEIISSLHPSSSFLSCVTFTPVSFIPPFSIKTASCYIFVRQMAQFRTCAVMF